MRAALVALALYCFVPPVSAETTEEKRKAIVEAFEASLREHVVFLNCSATDPTFHKAARLNWEEMAAATIEEMTKHKVEAALIAQIEERAAYAKVMRLDAPLREIIALCPENWQRPFYEFRFILLHNRVGEILRR